MQVTINGEHKSLQGPATVADLLSRMNIDGRVAVEINREILPRSQFSRHEIRHGDVLEIVRAIGGG